MMDQLAKSNRSRMEHVALFAINKGYAEIMIIIARLEHKFIRANQVSALIDRQVHSDQDFTLRIWKSCDK